MLLITQPRVGTSHNEIIALQMAAASLGWDVLPAPTSWRLEEDLIKSGVKGLPYGSQLFCEVVAQQMGWTLQANPFDWLATLPEYWLKRQIQFMTIKEAMVLTETKFIKPADDKCFDAAIYKPGELDQGVLPDDSPVLVSSIVEWDLEYRCFVDIWGVQTWSNYIFYDKAADPKYWNMVPMPDSKDRRLPTDVVNDVVHHAKFHPGFDVVPSVIDVGRIPGKGWAIIETNPAWASGLYGCDPVAALKVMEQAVR